MCIAMILADLNRESGVSWPNISQRRKRLGLLSLGQGINCDVDYEANGNRTEKQTGLNRRRSGLYAGVMALGSTLWIYVRQT